METKHKQKEQFNEAVAIVAVILLGGKTWIRTARGVTTRKGIVDLIEEVLAYSPLLQAAKCAVLDLEGYRLSHDIDIDGDHPTALTLKELRAAIKIADPNWTIE